MTCSLNLRIGFVLGQHPFDRDRQDDAFGVTARILGRLAYDLVFANPVGGGTQRAVPLVGKWRIDGIIRAGHAVVFSPDTLAQAHAEGYGNGAYCIGSSNR